MLDDIAKIFKKAPLWDGKDLNSLRCTVAILEYEFAHTMPFQRGSAAVSEWIEEAIYQLHGFKVIYSKDKNVNLESLTSNFEEFMENYPSMIDLQKV